jgi:hypothetical protein
MFQDRFPAHQGGDHGVRGAELRSRGLRIRRVGPNRLEGKPWYDIFQTFNGQFVNNYSKPFIGDGSDSYGLHYNKIAPTCHPSNMLISLVVTKRK